MTPDGGAGGTGGIASDDEVELAARRESKASSEESGEGVGRVMSSFVKGDSGASGGDFEPEEVELV